ncbi:MAG: DUF2789 family protein [Brachymonas sp.]|nr:DUF2789 family protein [Brachymonas sp.]
MAEDHTCFTELFEQLGLPSTPEAIKDFIHKHRPLRGDLLLYEAPFWDKSQATFLCEKRQQDSPEWTQIIDRLNLALRD